MKPVIVEGQRVLPDCCTWKVALPPWNSTRIVPVRAVPLLAATLYAIVPGLAPEVSPVNEIHGVDVDAAHEQPVGVLRVALNENAPPSAPTVCDDGASVYAQSAVEPS